MRTRIAIALGILSALLAVGCGGGRGDDSTPVACLEGTGTYLKALRSAPGAVRLAGETPISDCLVVNQQGGDLATLGEATVEAATQLNARARAEDGAEAALRLGYLIGAAQRGADGTEGIHSDLIRRLTIAARFSPDRRPLSPAFLAAYERGFAAGHSGG
ncbi:MAG TPA: hypothetical protein VHI77_02940 [Solirubrobacterales bacterium]|nr:hypothetical protein [Solirubrobacterales bacterium]